MRYVQFFTATILNWHSLIERNDLKDIIIEGLQHRVNLKQVIVHGFVIMPNHMHIIWRIDPDIEREAFQRDLLKRISKRIVDTLKAEQDSATLLKHKVNTADRNIQIWERNALSIDIYSQDVFNQKLQYIHNNPLQEKWKLVEYPADYKYSSAKFYETDVDEFGFLTRIVAG